MTNDMPNDENLAWLRPEPDGLAPVCGPGMERPVAADPSGSATWSLAALGEMTGGIAHDFLNILAVIGSGLTLAERTNDPAKAQMYVAAARDSIRRGVDLTNQLLEFAKQRQFEPSVGNANHLLGNLDVFLKYGAGPAISVVFELAAELPRCLIDSSQFNAAILNLVVNARDAMPSGGEVRISTEYLYVETTTAGSFRPGGYVRVRVRDNGHGMSPETVQRVFDPFFTTKGQRGTGLGLPQVCAFMRLIGGHVTIASKRGFGTLVDLFFPAVEEMEVVTILMKG